MKYVPSERSIRVPKGVSMNGKHFGIGGSFKGLPEGSQDQYNEYAKKYPKSTTGKNPLLITEEEAKSLNKAKNLQKRAESNTSTNTQDTSES